MASTAELLLPRPGELVAGKYRVQHPLGEGGMAHVFAAHHELLDKPIALKILSRICRLEDERNRDARIKTFADRFLAEARAAARIDSPHVTRVVEVGTLPNGLPFMVMERLVGCDIEALLERKEVVAIETIVDWILQALDGVAHAHGLGIIHRDLKPGNLFLCDRPEGGSIVKVMDFGIAKFSDTDARVGKLTGDGGAVGSPSYMSPEQIRNASAVDERADIWALGVVLYELLTGITPFEGDEVGQILAAVLERPIVHPRELRPEIPRRLDEAIMFCLERDPDRRCPNVAELARRLEPFASRRWAPLVANIERTLSLRRCSTSGVRIHPNPRTSSGGFDTTMTLDEPAPPRRWRRVVAVASLGVVLVAAGFIALRNPTADARDERVELSPRIVATEPALVPVVLAPPIAPQPTTSAAPTAIPKPKASARPNPSAAPSASAPVNLFDERF